MTEEKNEFGKMLEEWWNSDAFKEMEKSHQESLERAVGKYFMLSESDKIDMIQAICYIMCKAEREGISHRGLQDELGVYPAGFWVSELMDVHNALHGYYDKMRQTQELEKDVEILKSYTNNKDS